MGRKKGERDRVWNRWGGRNGKEESWREKVERKWEEKVEKVKRKGERDGRE